MTQSERDAIGPRRVLRHIGFAVVGFGLWVAYATTDTDALGWAAMACLAVAFAIAGTFLITRDQHRRADLAGMRDHAIAPLRWSDPVLTKLFAAKPEQARLSGG